MGLHRLTLSNGAEVWSQVSPEGEQRIEITWATPENGLYLSLSDAAMLSMLAHDIYNGRVRRIDRPTERIADQPRRDAILKVLNDDLSPWHFNGSEPMCIKLFAAADV